METLTFRTNKEQGSNYINKLINSPYFIGCEDVIQKNLDILKSNGISKFDVISELIKTTVENDDLVIEDEFFKELQSADMPHNLNRTDFKGMYPNYSSIKDLYNSMKSFCINYLYKVWSDNKEYVIGYFNSNKFKVNLECYSQKDVSQDEFIKIFLEASLSVMYDTLYALIIHELGNRKYNSNELYDEDDFLYGIATGEFITHAFLDKRYRKLPHIDCKGIIRTEFPNWFLFIEIYDHIKEYKEKQLDK